MTRRGTFDRLPRGADRPRGANSRRSTVIHPDQLAVAADSGSRGRTAIALQASAGNRAVAASLADIAHARATHASVAVVGTPASTAAPAPQGVQQIATAAEGRHAAGVTTLPAPGAPDVVIGAPLRQTDGKWQATVQSTTVAPDRPISLFPGVGVHDEGTTATGMIVRRDVTGPASNEIRRGEEEHLLDLEWARHLAYDEAADAVNRVAASGPATGNSADEARAAAMDRVRSEVPGRGRWPAGVDPITHWRRMYGRLVAVTQERDSPNAWHSINTEIVMDPAAKRRLGLPAADELRRYIPGTTQVGQHPSEPLVRARYDAQPVGPAAPTGAPTQPTGATPQPTGAFSPAGDYEYKPAKERLAVRSKRAPA